jgi:hypothetical protein
MQTVLSDGTTSVDFYDTSFRFVRNSEGNSLGEPLTSPRTIALDIHYGSRTTTREQVFQDVNTVRLLLNKASDARLQGMGRVVTLTIQVDNLSVPVIYDVLGGRVPVPSLWDQLDLVNNKIAPIIELDVEPLGRSAEIVLINSTGTVSGINIGVTHHYVAYTGGSVFSVNTVGQVEGSLWQSDRLTAAPTLRSPQNGDVLYWGNNVSGTGWDRLIFGIRTPRTGNITGVWEYSTTAGAWATFSPSSSFRTTPADPNTEFMLAANLGEINWLGVSMPNWINGTVNGVSALWVRYRITSFTNMPQVPFMMNGPFRSHFGIGLIPPGSVPGDVPADALIHFTNASGGELSGVRTGVASALLSPFMPPFIVEWENADLYAPSSGDVAVAVSAPPSAADASGGADVAITVGTPVSGAADKAQHFTGGQYITAAVGASDKIGVLGSKGFFIEEIFTLDTAAGVPQNPTCLVSQWTNVSTNKVFWCGIDQGRLRMIVKDDNGHSYSCNGGTDLQAGIPYLATFEFHAAARYIRIFLNAVEDGKRDVPHSTLRTGQTIALRVGVSIGFDTTDSKDRNSAETPLEGTVSFLWIVGTRIRDAWGGSTQYRQTWPGKQEHVAADISASAIQLLWNMNDYAASATITDSGNGTLKNGTRTGAPVNTNDAANAKLGYYSAGVQVQALGIRLPQCYSDEHAGSYRVLMAAAPPASGFTNPFDLEMSLQFNRGDNQLPMSTAPRIFPDVADVRASNRYHLIDFGVVTFPVVGLWDGHRAMDAGRNVSHCYLFLRSTLPPGTVFWVDCLYFIPTNRFYGSYDSFRSVLKTGFNIAVNAGVGFDGRGQELIVSQSFANNYQATLRNPWSKWDAGNPRLYPEIRNWIFAVPVFPEDLTNDSSTRAGRANVTPRVSIIPRWVAAASA